MGRNYAIICISFTAIMAYLCNNSPVGGALGVILGTEAEAVSGNVGFGCLFFRDHWFSEPLK